jgi:hypothetical protein
MLGLIEFATVADEKKEYKKQKIGEYRDADYDGTTNNYNYLKKTLRNYIENKWVDGKITANVPFERPETATSFTYIAGKDTPPIDLMELLDDCYGIITYNRMDINSEIIKTKKPRKSKQSIPIIFIEEDSNTNEKKNETNTIIKTKYDCFWEQHGDGKPSQTEVKSLQQAL